MHQIHLLSLCVLLAGFISCTPNQKNASSVSDVSNTSRSVTRREVTSNIISPAKDTVLNLGEDLILTLAFQNESPIRVEASLNGSNLTPATNADFSLVTISTSQGKIGENQLQLKITTQDSLEERIAYAFRLLSDLTPVRQSYTVVDEFPHNDESFTQGLFYRNGAVCEGSGLQGKSVITCFEPRTGNVLQQAFMPPEYFGEGVTQLENILYQLTYKANKIILYNPDNLSKIGEKYWPSEGWGITHDGKQLIISDGSNHIYFIDPVSMTELRRVTVADHTRFYDRLNELEYVEGVIYANVWLTDSIIGIEPKMGKVVSTLDLKNILPGFNSEEQEDYVLNGTAYIPERRSMLVTGKQWPKMFEVQLNPLVPEPQN